VCFLRAEVRLQSDGYPRLINCAFFHSF
jgi:hypothetical protein